MEQEELKRKLLGLWERTTHNSKEILSVLFDYYFDMNYVVYKEQDGKVVSALCGIPYHFGYGSKLLKALYIISLSSEEGYRKKSVLADLLLTLEGRIEKDYDFTFLVPSTALLADYYGTQGYFSSFFILEERFTPMHDFINDYLLSLLDSDERIRNLKKDLLEKISVTDNSSGEFSQDQIIEFIRDNENKSAASVNLLHTEKDLKYLLGEKSIRELSYFLAKDSDNKITGVAFTKKEEMKRTRVVASYVADSCSYYALLEFIRRAYPDNSMSVNNSDPQFQSHSIIQQTYAAANPDGGDLDNTFNTVEIPFNVNKLLQPMGMVKLLRFDRILEYIAATRSDVDFKLHIRDYSYKNEKTSVEPQEGPQDALKGNSDASIHTLFVIRNGECKMQKFDPRKKDRSVLDLNIKELSELLLRKNDSSNLIMEAFGIPRLNLQFRLLPC